MEEVERKTVKRKLRQLRRSALKGQGGEGEGSSTMMLAQKERRGKSRKSKKARKQPFFKLSFSATALVIFFHSFIIGHFHFPARGTVNHDICTKPTAGLQQVGLHGLADSFFLPGWLLLLPYAFPP
jgi:hypothetical protein